jgi:DnaJ homolog subfamily B member 12
MFLLQLALILHPDKAKGTRTEEAFKAISQAFSCLSDREKRAHYDRTGYESVSAAAAARPRDRRNQQQYYTTTEEFDPEEIFNMFFG